MIQPFSAATLGRWLPMKSHGREGSVNQSFPMLLLNVFDKQPWLETCGVTRKLSFSNLDDAIRCARGGAKTTNSRKKLGKNPGQLDWGKCKNITEEKFDAPRAKLSVLIVHCSCHGIFVPCPGAEHALGASTGS